MSVASGEDFSPFPPRIAANVVNTAIMQIEWEIKHRQRTIMGALPPKNSLAL